MADNKPLQGRLALVTGASKGIGAATAKKLAAAGAHVVLTGRDVRALEQVEDAIHELGGTATIAPLDLTEADAIARLVSAISTRWHQLDYLVICAAYLPTLTPVTQIDAKQFSQAITINVLATQALLAGFDPMLKRSDVARVMSTTPARIGQLAGYESPLAVGSPAHVTLVDPRARGNGEMRFTRSSNNPYRGRELPGEVRYTIYGGKITLSDGTLVDAERVGVTS